MKAIFILLTALLVQPSLATPKMSDITNEEISCLASNGVRLEVTNSETNDMMTTWGKEEKAFKYTMFPVLGGVTWIAISEEGKPIKEGFEIFLMGHPVKNTTTRLWGWIGHIPGEKYKPKGGRRIPTGFIPFAGIACDIYFESKSDK